MYLWRTTARGVLELDSGSGFFAPHLDLTHVPVRLKWSRSRRWASLAREVKPNNLPLHWVLGTIYRESGGNPRAVSPDRGFGLMQLTSESARGGLSDAECLEPRRNLTQGCRWWWTNCVGHQRALDLPRATSWFNAGGSRDGRPHVNKSSPWGLAETRWGPDDPGHIYDVVSAANTAHAEGLWDWPGVRGSGGSDLLPLLLLGAGAYLVTR